MLLDCQFFLRSFAMTSLQRGKIEHAMRVTFKNTRRAYVYPATHSASSKTDENLPRMGERLRLCMDFDTSGFSPPVTTILEALKRFGIITADNGIDLAISIAPDERIPEIHDELRKIKVSDFEVVTPPVGYITPQQERGDRARGTNVVATRSHFSSPLCRHSQNNGADLSQFGEPGRKSAEFCRLVAPRTDSVDRTCPRYASQLELRIS